MLYNLYNIFYLRFYLNKINIKDEIVKNKNRW